MKIKSLAGIALSLMTWMILSLACGSSAPTSVPPMESQDDSGQMTPTPETQESVIEKTTRVPEQALADEGPWWIFSTTDGLYATNPDGTGLTQFHSEPIQNPYLFRIQAAPSGGGVAYLTGDGWFDTTLNVTVFPGLERLGEIALTSQESEPSDDAMPGDPAVEAIRAMTEVDSLAFSPDGNTLAFMAAIEGPTSDLYTLSLDDFETVRHTSGPSQAYQPTWSPNGKYIVHTGAGTFGTGAGYSMEGVWASLADASGVIDLYAPPALSGGEEIVGWVDDRTFLVYTWSPSCGPNNLRTFNIETGESNIIWPEFFSVVAYDPQSSQAVVGVRFEECNTDGQTGHFLVPTDGRPPFRFVEDRPFQIIWSPEAQLFLSSTEFSTIAISPSGEFIDLDQPQGADVFPAVAPGSRTLAWPGEALWIGPLLGSIENPPQRSFDEPVSKVTWDPSGDRVIFFADSGLYVAEAPEFDPTLVAEGLDHADGYTGWVFP